MSLENTLFHYNFRLLKPFANNDLVGVKINIFGTLLPEWYRKIVRILRNKDITPFICDTSNRFCDRQANGIKHVTTAIELGLGAANLEAPFMMLDGINGNYETIVTVDNNVKVFLAGELANIDGLLLVTTMQQQQFDIEKSIMSAMGTGLAAKRGKIKQLASSGPQVNSSHCYFCRKCLHECPVGAIEIEGRHVVINDELCIDCGKCVDLARYGGINYVFDAPFDQYVERMLYHASGALRVVKKWLFCEFLLDGKDVPCGILLARDPLAIDKAAYDLTIEKSDMAKAFFARAQALDLGEVNYQLVEIAY